jgi:prepilin-type N-terminal cleavage/methylation domain-containing protein/prepilin-type processing-associated H-X9-DG protein
MATGMQSARLRAVSDTDAVAPLTETSRANGFSLIELLLVLAIIMILTTLFLGGGSQSHQTRMLAKCGQNLQNVYVSLKTFSTDNQDKLPALTNAQTSEPVLSLLIPKYTTETAFFVCPGCSDSAPPDAKPFPDGKISYAYYMGHKLVDGADKALVTDRQINTNPKLAGQQLFSADGKKPGANHNKYGGNILFCDGNIQSSPAYSAFDLTNGAEITLLNPKP